MSSGEKEHCCMPGGEGGGDSDSEVIELGRGGRGGRGGRSAWRAPGTPTWESLRPRAGEVARDVDGGVLQIRASPVLRLLTLGAMLVLPLMRPPRTHTPSAVSKVLQVIRYFRDPRGGDVLVRAGNLAGAATLGAVRAPTVLEMWHRCSIDPHNV